MLEGGDAEIHDGGDGRHFHVPRSGDAVLHIPIDRILGEWGPAHSGQRFHASGFCGVDEEGYLAPDATRSVIGHLKCEDGGHGGIRRVAAGFEHLQPRIDSTCASRCDRALLTRCFPSDFVDVTWHTLPQTLIIEDVSSKIDDRKSRIVACSSRFGATSEFVTSDGSGTGGYG